MLPWHVEQLSPTDVRGLLEGDRRRFARDASVLVWLTHVLRPLLALSVREGIALAMAERPQLDVMRIEGMLRDLMERAPGQEPEP